MFASSYREQTAGTPQGRAAAGLKGWRLAGLRERIERILYSLYERRLMAQLRGGRLPRHIGIILDGNRRFGRRRRIADPQELYALGAATLDHVLHWCTALGIPAVTLWVCSTRNLPRRSEERRVGKRGARTCRT